MEALRCRLLGTNSRAERFQGTFCFFLAPPTSGTTVGVFVLRAAVQNEETLEISRESGDTNRLLCLLAILNYQSGQSDNLIIL